MAQTRTRPEPKAAPLPPASDQTIQEGADLTAEQIAAAEAQAETTAAADEGPPQPPRQTTRHYATGRRQPKTIDDQTKLFDYILELSEEEFANNFKAYIYRTEPFTQTQAQEFKYVTRYDQKFDVEVMKRELGSGRYYIRLNHSTSVGVGQSRQILAESIAIEDPQHPPNIPAGPWLDDPRNKKWAQWFRAKNQADAGATAQATAQANAQSPREMVGALKDLIQMMRPNDSANAQQNTVSAVRGLGTGT